MSSTTARSDTAEGADTGGDCRGGAQRSFREGSIPSVEQAAAAAGVSRATAYPRYFPTQEALHVELASKTAWVSSLLRMRLGAMTSPDVESRLVALIDLVGAAVADNEVHVRTALRVYLRYLVAEPSGAGEQTPVRLRSPQGDGSTKSLETAAAGAGETKLARLASPHWR